MADYGRMISSGFGSRVSTRELNTQPIFLVGCVRSGTTLLRLMLDHHPEVAFESEFEYAVERIDSSGEFPRLEEYHEFLQSNRIFLDSDRVIDPKLDFKALVRSFLQQKQGRSGKLLVGATVHRHFDRILRIWPQARFIHLVRDARDVCLSIEASGWAGSAYAATDQWIDVERTWDSLCREVPEDRRLEIRFEDLVAETGTTLEQICGFLGIDYSDEMLSYAAKGNYPLPSRSRCEAWREAAPETVALMEARLGRMLVRRGYDWSGLPVPAVTLGEHRRLMRQSRIRHFTRRVREQGPAVFCAEILGRRLGLGLLSRWSTPRLHAQERATLR